MSQRFKKVSLVVVFIVLIGLVYLDLEAPDGVAEVLNEGTGGSSRLSELLGSGADAGYPQALQARAFSFPADHGPHPEYRNEWWYLTGNLAGPDGDRFGYELTLFRFALTPQHDSQEGVASSWKTNQVYIGHFAVSDLRDDKFHVAQRYSRGAAGLAGAQAEPLRVWIDDWTIADGGGDGTWIVQAEENGVAVDLRLTAEKPPVLNGDAGLSKKSSRPGNASYYYSITRMHTEGEIRTGKSRSAVSGLSWLDREWGSSALAPEQIGWDWFALQLSDGSDLMFYNLRQVNGMQDPHSAGTWTDASGNSQHLRNDEVQITVRDYWDSEHGGRYPGAWTLEIPARNIRLEVKPVIENQELITTVRYWEGAVDVQGKSGSVDITGHGYVELTGYAE